ncbi:hypothetical protein [Streptomyces sp. NBC_01465]|uniref:hypothetical protein n=1 Tax=Streptomyces sp. NBC_01465 TaxID=2903878 RepID=UPI002E3289AF|nr:hypothetical protein [Streptomyces sp. NBC_01465]
MLRHNAWRAALVGTTLTAVTALGAGAASAAGAQADSIACHYDGAICMTTNDPFEPTVLVADGDSYDFVRATEITSISNDTTMTYCVVGDYTSTITPGQSIEVTRTLTSVVAAPDGHCVS